MSESDHVVNPALGMELDRDVAEVNACLAHDDASPMQIAKQYLGIDPNASL